MSNKSITMQGGRVDLQGGRMDMDFTTAEAIVFRLFYLAASVPDDAEKNRINSVADYLKNHLQRVEVVPGDDGKAFVSYTAKGTERANVERALSDKAVRFVIAEIAGAIRKTTQSAAPPRKKKKSALPPPGVRVSGHLIDHTLTKRQLSLFDDKVSALVAGAELESSALDLGRLSLIEERVIGGIAILLHTRSTNTTDAGGPNYYTGNKPAIRVPYDDETATAPVIEFTWYELATTIMGTRPGGNDLEKVRGTVLSLAKKMYTLISYYRKGADGDQIRVTDAGNIFSFRERYAEVIPGQQSPVRKAEAVTLILSPIFRDQIASKYVTIPGDFFRKVSKLSGRATIGIDKFLLYLYREASAKRTECKISISKLCEYMELSNTMRVNAGRATAQIEKGIKVAQGIGVLETYTTATGVSGELVYTFKLSKKS